jgi:hypothetical protein
MILSAPIKVTSPKIQLGGEYYYEKKRKEKAGRQVGRQVGQYCSRIL